MAARGTITGSALASMIVIAAVETPPQVAEMRHVTLENPLQEEASKGLVVTETIRQAAEEEINVIATMDPDLVLEAVMTTKAAPKVPRRHHHHHFLCHQASPRIVGGIVVVEATTAETATATAIVIGTVIGTVSAEMAMEVPMVEAAAATPVPGFAKGEGQRAVVKMDHMTKEGR